MAEELGKIEKPEAGKFENKRKLCLVPLLYSWQDAPAEYADKLNLYWQQVSEHVANLESKIGKVNRIFHESITEAGEEGLKILEKLSPSSCQIASEKCQSGAQLEAVEDMELVGESMDWERHLLIGFISQKVAQMVSGFYTEASRKRYEHIAGRIDETLKDNEVALLFIREGHLVQFPPDIEVFSVVPPVLDEIHRWFRDRSAADKAEEPTDKTDEPTDKTDEPTNEADETG
ncbi:hypothetical protein ACFLU1_00185 [Chloroflexota bacterium]